MLSVSSCQTSASLLASFLSCPTPAVGSHFKKQVTLEPEQCRGSPFKRVRPSDDHPGKAANAPRRPDMRLNEWSNPGFDVTKAPLIARLFHLLCLDKKPFPGMCPVALGAGHAPPLQGPISPFQTIQEAHPETKKIFVFSSQTNRK